MQKEYLQALYKYNDYANHLVMDVVGRMTTEELNKQSSPSHGTAQALLLHMMGAELFFLKTCQQQPMPKRDEKKEPDMVEFRSFWQDFAKERTAYLQSLTEEALLEEVNLTFPDRSYHLPRWQLLTQAFLHSVHHRGELSIVLSGLGYPLPTLDIIIPFLKESGQGWN